MSPIPANVLAQIREDIAEAEAALKDLDTEISKARLAGVNVTDKEKEAADLKTQIRQLKAVYGKGGK